MPLETASSISDLVVTNPAHTDGLNNTDAHLRLLKSTLKTTFPNITGVVSASQSALNYLSTTGLRGPDGSSGAPSLSFASEPTLGFYRSAPGSVTLTGTFGATLLFGGSLITTGNATVGGALSAASGSITNALSAGSFSCGVYTGGLNMASVNAAIEIGAPGTTNTPFIDFHSGATAVDFDSRIIATGGNGSFGGGTLTVQAAAFNIQGGFSANASTINGNSTVAGNETVTGTLTAGTFVGAVPAGTVMMFAGATAPAGWAPCDGAAVSRATYAQLYANIGTTWGSGDGATTFNLPNLLSRFPRHRDNSTLSGAVGNTQGPVNLAHTHTVSGNTGGASQGHTHDISTGTVSTTSTAHTHGVSAVGVGGMSANAVHSHGLTNVNGASVLSSAGGSTNYAAGAFGAVAVSSSFTVNNANIDHTHALSGSTDAMSANGTHAHTLSGSTGSNSVDHTHGINFASQSSGDANEARPYSATMLFCVKLFN